MKTKVVILAGIGESGKTSVINQIKEFEPMAKVLPSITRKVYQQWGLENEKAFYELSKSEQVRFQSDVYTTYLKTVSEFIDEGVKDKAELIVIDRSPYDYASYQVSQIQELPQIVIESLISRANDMMSELDERDDIDLDVFVFPYPNPWEKKDDDAWRYSTGAKSYSWHSVLVHMIRGWNAGHIQFGNVRALESKTIRGRAYEVLGRMRF